MPLNINVQQILLHALNFVILAVGLYLLLYGPVVKFMEKRRVYFADMEKDAQEKQKKLDELEAEYNSKLENVNEEIHKLHAEAMEKLDEEKKLSLKNAKVEADEIIAAAQRQAQAEKEKALRSTRREIAGMVADAAEKLMINRNTPENDSALYDRFIDSAEEEAGE